MFGKMLPKVKTLDVIKHSGMHKALEGRTENEEEETELSVVKKPQDL